MVIDASLDTMVAMPCKIFSDYSQFTAVRFSKPLCHLLPGLSCGYIRTMDFLIGL